jgi:hypothetical protein
MKKRFSTFFITSIMAAIAGVAVIVGCKNPATTALNSDAVLITSVNAAMTAWKAEVNAGKASPAQVTTVSNAYVAYYNSQIVVSNLAAAYVANPTTDLSGAITTAESALASSSSNIVTIINTFSK